MYDTYLVAEDNSVWCSNEGYLLPDKKYIAKIECDPRDYTASPEDTTVCDVQTGVAIQFTFWLRLNRSLQTLPHFRTYVSLEA